MNGILNQIYQKKKKMRRKIIMIIRKVKIKKRMKKRMIQKSIIQMLYNYFMNYQINLMKITQIIMKIIYLDLAFQKNIFLENQKNLKKNQMIKQVYITMPQLYNILVMKTILIIQVEILIKILIILIIYMIIFIAVYQII